MNIVICHHQLQTDHKKLIYLTCVNILIQVLNETFARCNMH